MNYRKMSKPEAKDWVDRIDALSDEAFEDLKFRWGQHEIEDELSGDYFSLREKILKAFDAGVIKGTYAIDLEVGFCLYRELNLEAGFTNALANDDDVWRYLSCVVFPDITYKRYPKPASGDIRLAKKRFYSHPRRIWLKTLWWYIHLSWQGTEEATREILRGLGSDTISDLIERTGKGYRLSLYREMMRGYSTVPNKKTDLFNKLCTQNRVNCRTIEPALTQGGERSYVTYMLVQLGQLSKE